MMIGTIQVLRNADGVGWCKISGKNRYEGVRFNVISVTGGSNFQKKELRNTWMAPYMKDEGELNVNTDS